MTKTRKKNKKKLKHSKVSIPIWSYGAFFLIFMVIFGIYRSIASSSGSTIEVTLPTTTNVTAAATSQDFNFSANTGKEYALWMRSSPKLIGRGTADTDGNINATFSIPANIALGDHTLELNAFASGGKVRTVQVGAVVLNNNNLNRAILIDQNPVEKYLESLSVLMSLIFLVLMVGVWAVGATIRDQRLLRAQIRNRF